MQIYKTVVSHIFYSGQKPDLSESGEGIHVVGEMNKEPCYLPHLWFQPLLGLAPSFLSCGLDFLLLLQS